MRHKWLTKLIRYDYENIYKSGKENKVVHALSRVHEKEESHPLWPYEFPIAEWYSILQNE